MHRKAVPLLFLLSTLLPVAAAGQVVDTSRAAPTRIRPDPSDSGRTHRIEAGTTGQVFLGAFQTILDYHRTTFSDSALWESALEGLIRGLDDPYATVFTAEEYGAFEEDNTGDYAGIGVQITRLNERVTITAVFRKTPASDVGLLVGDRIVRVGESDATAWTVDRARDSIRGPVGTQVRLAIEREGMAEPLEFTIPRAEVHVSAVTAATVRDSIGYILVDRMAQGSAAEVDSALALLSDAKGIVLDLRRNPGGYLVEALSMADLFLPPGQTLARTRSRTPGRPNATTEESWRARLGARIPEKPLVVLVDRFTASAAEIVTGALQDYDRAAVLGERTFGKGVVQTVLPLPGERRIRLTTGEWLTPLGRSLHIPRDAEGRPLPSAVDTGKVAPSAGGRPLRADGGVFPDLVVQDDTLTTAERNLLLAAAKAGVPLTQRIAEFAFTRAKQILAGRGSPGITPSDLDDFVTRLKEEGIPAEALAPPEARQYLSWRARISLAERADRMGEALEAQAERDRALERALEFLEEATSPADLLDKVAHEALRQAPATAGS